MLEDLIRQHAGRTALQFSGGRDSLAMLLLLRPLWDQLTVYYCDAGDAYPETRALIARVRATVPHFVQVEGHVLEVSENRGWATDVAAAGANWIGGVRMIDRYECCFHSIMWPLHERMRADGMALLLRGQRDSDVPRSPVRHLEMVDGMTVGYPIGSWSAEQVERYILAHGWAVPPFYAAGANTASDCMHCTGWLEHNSIPYLEQHHPVVAAVVNARLRQIRIAVEPHYARLVRATEHA